MIIFNNSWDELLKEEFKKDYYQRLRKILINEYKNYEVFPDMNLIFDSLKKVSYEDVKVVIIGQDPYHGPGQAHGHSFSVMPKVMIPPSLRNIYKEIVDDVGGYIPNNGYLMKWVNQGVLLLNTTLTVRRGKANSHRDIGWQVLTDRIIEILGEKKDPLVFILWGAHAISKKRFIQNKNHLVIQSPHPSPLSAYRGFFGSRPFSKTNRYLKDNGLNPIDWQIENI
ncbi:uracil-DNA glycosylase [Lagierella sp.]|uniref:uracil-DNA glycosylase n=1 Tax=Lagierella sp. TaxID=2849657 RepID=UPI0026203027|nr:uracil-DNA glycosylase [Lagierella sp.]